MNSPRVPSNTQRDQSKRSSHTGLPAEDAEAPGNTFTSAPLVADDFADESDEFESDNSDLTSLSSSILEYEYENGRRYHSNRISNYMYIHQLNHRIIGDVSLIPKHSMPNDEEEQDRMDLTHHIWLLLMKGELYKAPITNPQKVLDLGTGTGIWALDLAEKFPMAKIIGNDISAIQPNWVNPNVEFVVDDFEAEWIYEPESFDFIHGRLLAGCVADWPRLFKRCYDNLKPGAYLEIQESAVWAWSDDGTCPPDSPIFELLRAMDLASQAIGKPYNVYPFLRQWLIEAGFEDVTQFVYFLPYSPWPKDPYLKELGKFQAAMVQHAIEAYSLRLFTQVLGWGEDVSRIFQASVKRQLRDKHMHAYVKEYVVFGRKPLR